MDERIAGQLTLLSFYRRYVIAETLTSFGLRDPRFRAFRAQNRGFCALLGSGTPVFGLFEHKIKVFVRFWGLKPSFSGISSTKSGFLCAFGLRDHHFLAFRAQNRVFCALLPAGRAERAGRAGRAGRAERTRRAERAGRAERAKELNEQEELNGRVR